MFRLGEAMSILARKVRDPSGKFALAHPFEKVQILFRRAVPVRALLARFGQTFRAVGALLRRSGRTRTPYLF